MFVWIDGHGFLTGSRSFTDQSTPNGDQNELYQTEVSALVSLALLLIRLVAAMGSTRIVWSLIEVLLETCGLSLSELLLVVSFRIPVRLRFESYNHLLWSLLALLVISLSVPANLSAPLATSSLAWVPSVRLPSSPLLVDIRRVGDQESAIEDDAFGNFTLWPEDRWRPIIQATLGATIDNGYAFTNESVPVRRLFTATNMIPLRSTVDLTVPFINVTLKWIDGGPHDRGRFRWLGNRNYISASGITIDDTGIGGVSFYREQVFNASNSRPKNTTVFEGVKYVLVRTGRVFHDTLRPDGSLANESTPCPSEDPQLGILPNVRTADYASYRNGTIFDVRECFHVAEASIRAGVHQMKDCNITYSSDIQTIATCQVEDSTAAIENDLLVDLTLDVMSEVIRNVRPLNTTSRYMEQGIDAYTIGMLRLAYHSAWSSLTNDLGRATETISVRHAESVVRASVARTRLYIWLGTQIALELSAIILYGMLKRTGIKATRDPTLTALTMDISSVSHSGMAPGLCNAVTLDKTDKKLPDLARNIRPRREGDQQEDMEEEDSCVRRVTFVAKD
jgi:hypothetical protein